MIEPSEWFFEDELSRLRWQWVASLRAYGRSREPATLRELRAAQEAYVARAGQLHSRAISYSAHSAKQRSHL